MTISSGDSSSWHRKGKLRTNAVEVRQTLSAHVDFVDSVTDIADLFGGVNLIVRTGTSKLHHYSPLDTEVCSSCAIHL